MSKPQESALKLLLPTQLTVGMIEVRDKAAHLTSMQPKERREFLLEHPMPVVLGPAGRRYITDHHHLARAALEAGLETAFYVMESDLSTAGPDAFWIEMDRNNWVHPLDENGVRHHYATLPGDLRQLVDDPYRSLAAAVRNAGGYLKTSLPFAEFIWADFFRRMIAIEDLRANFHAAVETAMPLARSHLAAGLPGYHKK